MRTQRPAPPPTDASVRVLIVCDHASARFGGEAMLPLHHFRTLRELGIDVWLLAHARSRAEIQQLFPGESRIRFVEETAFDRCMWAIGRRLPSRIDSITTAFAARMSVQRRQRPLIRGLVGEAGIDVVHQPTPVSPREPSLLHGLGAPLVVGPMNGDMDYPPAFRGIPGRLERVLLLLGRMLSPLLGRLLPGKRRAALLLAANDRTRATLSPAPGQRVERLVENGVELDLWQGDATRPARSREEGEPATFVFVGRLIRLKAVDLLLEALATARTAQPMRLVVIGDGPERDTLRRQAERLFGPDGDQAVSFAGALPQSACAEALRAADALVLPSLHDCGGAVVLEAMAAARPVIATAWGGPLDYLDDASGILVEPTSRDALVAGLADAMVRLAAEPATCRAMGEAAREYARRHHDWSVKGRRMLALHRQVAAAARECPERDAGVPSRLDPSVEPY